MKDEAHTWVAFADENLEVAVLAIDHGHLNACLQNAQQAVEKYLKALIVEYELPFLRTHSTREILRAISVRKISPPLSEDEIDLMDAIYVPSKYPVYSALPYAMPEPAICREALDIARRIKNFVRTLLKP